MGRLAQLVEHLVYTERVSGSNPLPPTILGEFSSHIPLFPIDGQGRFG